MEVDIVWFHGLLTGIRVAVGHSNPVSGQLSQELHPGRGHDQRLLCKAVPGHKFAIHSHLERIIEADRKVVKPNMSGNQRQLAYTLLRQKCTGAMQ